MLGLRVTKKSDVMPRTHMQGVGNVQGELRWWRDGKASEGAILAGSSGCLLGQVFIVHTAGHQNTSGEIIANTLPKFPIISSELHATDAVFSKSEWTPLPSVLTCQDSQAFPDRAKIRCQAAKKYRSVNVIFKIQATTSFLNSSFASEQPGFGVV